MWIEAYHDFIEEITAKYTARGNNPTFFVVCGPMISGGAFAIPFVLSLAVMPCAEVCTNVATAAKQNNATFINLQNILTDSDLGCNGHPNVQGHALMSSLVLPVMRQQMGW